MCLADKYSGMCWGMETDKLPSSWENLVQAGGWGRFLFVLAVERGWRESRGLCSEEVKTLENYVLLTVHLSMISVNNQLNEQILVL